MPFHNNLLTKIAVLIVAKRIIYKYAMHAKGKQNIDEANAKRFLGSDTNKQKPKLKQNKIINHSL